MKSGYVYACVLAVCLATAVGIVMLFDKPSSRPLPVVAPPTVTVQQRQKITDLPADLFPKTGDEVAILEKRPDGVMIGIDVSSFKRDGDIASFLVVIVPPTVDAELISSTIVKQDFNCKNHTQRVEYAYVLGKDGTILDSRSEPDPWQDIKAGSSGKSLENMACAVPDGTPISPPAKKTHKLPTENI